MKGFLVVVALVAALAFPAYGSNLMPLLDDVNPLFIEDTNYTSLTSEFFFGDARGLTNIPGPTIGRVAYLEEFDNTDLSNGVLSVQHDLDTNRVIPKVYDGGHEQVLPDGVRVVDANNLDLNLYSFVPILGTWTALVVSANVDENAVFNDLNVASLEVDFLFAGPIYSTGDSNFGVVEATAFFGDGSGLTGVAADDDITVGRVGHTETFANGDLSAGVLSIAHSLDTNRVSAKVYDGEHVQVLPDNVQVTDGNNMDVNVLSFTPILGTWTVLVISGNQDLNATTVFDFDNSDLDNGQVTINHNLGKKYVAVKVVNDEDKVVIEDETVYLSANDLNVDLSSFGTIAGTWRVIVTP